MTGAGRQRRPLEPGGTITAIEPRPTDPNFRRIRVDGRVAAAITAAQLDQIGIEVGQPWTGELVRQVEHAILAGRIHRRAMNILGRRAYAHGELIERLVRAGFDRTAARATADDLSEQGWLDDRAYGESLVREWLRSKPAGARFLIQKLAQRRIDRTLAEDIVRSALASVDQVEEAERLARKRLPSLQRHDRATIIRRLTGLLARRGFEHDTIRTVVDRLKLDPACDT